MDEHSTTVKLNAYDEPNEAEEEQKYYGDNNIDFRPLPATIAANVAATSKFVHVLMCGRRHVIDIEL